MKSSTAIATTIALSSAVLFSAAASALNTSTPLSGQRHLETHKVINNGLGGRFCSALCIAQFSLDVEATWVIQHQNRSALTAAPTAVETYLTTDTDVTTPVAIYGNAYFPAGGFSADVGSGLPFSDWNFTTDEQGFITTGYLQNVIVNGGITFITVFDFDNRTVWGLSGCGANTSVSITEIRAWDYTNPLAAVPTGCGAVDTEVPMNYLNTDSNLVELEKAVPVPAFASLLLAIGLAGVTVLTGRRKKA